MQKKELIQTPEQFYQFLSVLEEQPIFAYDSETNGIFDRFKVGLVGLSFAWEGYSCYLPFNHDEGQQLFLQEVLEDLKRVFENGEQEKICHNVKFDEMVLSRYNVNVCGIGHDTYIMAWLLSEDRSSRGLKQLVDNIFGVEMETYEDVIYSTPKKKGIPRDYSFARVGLEEALSYAADDAYWTWKLFHNFKPKLEEENLWKAYTKIELPFVRILRALEDQGILIDQEALDYADKRLPEIAEQVEAKIYEEAGEVFNISSGKQLGHILFEKLGIGKNVPRTDSGNYSTNKKTLTNYAAKNPIVENVLRLKKIKKTHSTFIEGTKEFIAQDGRIHPSFNGTGTVTGRLSCRSPNLQQIEGDEVEEIKVRDFFIAAPGRKFLVADYAQMELRVLAHFSKDKEMTEAFMAGNVDFHEEIARRMFNVPKGKEVTRQQRVVAKTLNFGVGYGRGPTGISEQLEISMEEAQAFIDDWFKKFSGVRRYKEYVIFKARQDGFVRTLSGKKRRLLPEIRSNNWFHRGGAERQAFNTKIQGSAADIIKLAMISLQPYLVTVDSHMCLQIHDEIVIETPEELAEDVLANVKYIMENPLNNKNPLRLPLVVDPKIVDRWGEAK